MTVANWMQHPVVAVGVRGADAEDFERAGDLAADGHRGVERVEGVLEDHLNRRDSVDIPLRDRC